MSKIYPVWFLCFFFGIMFGAYTTANPGINPPLHIDPWQPHASEYCLERHGDAPPITKAAMDRIYAILREQSPDSLFMFGETSPCGNLPCGGE